MKLFDAQPMEVFCLYLQAPKIPDQWPVHATRTGTPIGRFTIDETHELVERDGFTYVRDLYEALEKMHGAEAMKKLFFATRFARKVT